MAHPSSFNVNPRFYGIATFIVTYCHNNGDEKYIEAEIRSALGLVD